MTTRPYDIRKHEIAQSILPEIPEMPLGHTAERGYSDEERFCRHSARRC